MKKLLLVCLLLANTAHSMKFRYGDQVRVVHEKFIKDTNLKFYGCKNDANILWYYYDKDRLFYKISVYCKLGGITTIVNEKDLILVRSN